MTKKNLLVRVLSLAFLVTMIGCGGGKPKVADIVVCHESCNTSLKACIDVVHAETDRSTCFMTNSTCMSDCARVSK